MKWIGLSILMLVGSQNILSNNFTVSHNGETIANVNRAYFSNPFIDIPLVNENNYEKFIQLLEKAIYQPPVNATLDDTGNIVPEKVGYKLDHDTFTKQFYTYYFNQGPANIIAPKQMVYPNVDSELLSLIRVKQIGHYTTFFNSGNKERSMNIKLASEAINNQVVFPGETFSFNKVVGKRTKEKGYMRAPVIVKGELSEDIGGGICQISSTLYNAVDNAGITITERYSHSKRVPYVPSGRDATVSWYGPDFRFTNKYNQPVLIRSKVYGGTVRIMVYSSEDINFKPKRIQKATYKLPKEIPLDSEVNRNHL